MQREKNTLDAALQQVLFSDTTTSKESRVTTERIESLLDSIDNKLGRISSNTKKVKTGR